MASTASRTACDSNRATTGQPRPRRKPRAGTPRRPRKRCASRRRLRPQPCAVPALAHTVHRPAVMRRFWIGLIAVLAVSFGVLGFVGSRIYQLAPPIPDRVVSRDGAVVFEPGQVAAGQDVWRSFGGMELGSIWGHGAYVAPDWTADWLHRELVEVLDDWSAAAGGA